MMGADSRAADRNHQLPSSTGRLTAKSSTARPVRLENPSTKGSVYAGLLIKKLSVYLLLSYLLLTCS